MIKFSVWMKHWTWSHSRHLRVGQPANSLPEVLSSFHTQHRVVSGKWIFSGGHHFLARFAFPWEPWLDLGHGIWAKICSTSRTESLNPLVSSSIFFFFLPFSFLLSFISSGITNTNKLEVKTIKKYGSNLKWNLLVRSNTL